MMTVLNNNRYTVTKSLHFIFEGTIGLTQHGVSPREHILPQTQVYPRELIPIDEEGRPPEIFEFDL